MAETKTNNATTTKVAKNNKKLRVTLVKSAIGYSKDQKRTVVALGLNKLNSSNELPDNSAVRGMIFKIKHLVRVEEI
ncbi:MAG: 50S ribosomal protein L30 [Clostridiales bacterium]|nr:50S ribosomal protein L30 [Clostridiales bacterium]